MSTAMGMPDDPRNGARTLWSWLRGTMPFTGRAVIDEPARSTVLSEAAFASQARAADMRDTEPGGAVSGTPENGVLLRFPIHGEALLVQLADLLRKQVASCGLERDPLLFMMSRCPGSRLSIDRIAYVDFLADRSAYHLVVEAAPDAKIRLDTTDFDTVVKFVVQYVAYRNSGPMALEAAS
jgi:hypothetical protein